MGRYDAGLVVHADAMVDRRSGNVAKNRQTHVLKKQCAGHMRGVIPETGDSIESLMVEPSLPSYRPTQRRAIKVPRGRYSRVSQSQVGAKQRAIGAGVVR